MTDAIPPFTTNELFRLLARSELLDEKLFDAQRQRFWSVESPAVIIAQMQAEHLLTPFQAKQLGERRHRGFFLSEKYKILDFLGQGGMSRVLLCEHLLLQRLVAVKILNKALDKFPGAADRFLREARASASMDHDNIARVFDVDRTSHGSCIVMEYVDGTNLHEIAVKHHLLPVDRVAHYISQAAEGLQHAHEAGLVHRDIKPANMMLDRTGTVKLLDLGLARFFDPSRSDNLTQQIDSTSIIGTADYIAPEQVMESSSADIRADIYSLGYSMYFLLTRTLPAGTGAAMRKLLWHQTREPEPVRTLRPEVPEELAAVLERMIKKKPGDRYQTPAEVVAALKPWTSISIERPTDEEMPKTRAITYRLGLCPPPKHSLHSSSPAVSIPAKSPVPSESTKPEQATPTVTAIAKSPNSGSSSSTIGYVNLKDDDSTASNSPNTAAAKTNEVMSISTETDSTSGSSYIRRLSELSLQDTATRRYAISIAGMAMAFVFGLFVASWWMSGRSGTTPSSNNAQGTDSVGDMATGRVVLRGGGSTFIRPVMEHWSRLYQQRTGIAIEYSAVGSSKGIDGFASNFLDFSCTDAFLTDEQLAEFGTDVVHVPLAVGAVVPAYNVTNTAGEALSLRFTGPMLANIYLGKIRKWNDPAIAVVNPGSELPDLEIQVVFRKDGSGTSAIWTDYLSKSSSAWKTQIGASAQPRWPMGIGVEKSDGIADAISRTDGALGYVELSYAVADGLSMGQVKNAAGDFVSPTIDSITAAAANPSGRPADLRFSLTDAPGPGSYPVAGTCWAIIRAHQSNDRAVAMIEFLQWATTEGQAALPALQYGRLPTRITEQTATTLNRLSSGL